jgi:hypothetical protein
MSSFFFGLYKSSVGLTFGINGPLGKRLRKACVCLLRNGRLKVATVSYPFSPFPQPNRYSEITTRLFSAFKTQEGGPGNDVTDSNGDFDKHDLQDQGEFEWNGKETKVNSPWTRELSG